MLKRKDHHYPTIQPIRLYLSASSESVPVSAIDLPRMFFALSERDQREFLPVVQTTCPEARQPKSLMTPRTPLQIRLSRHSQFGV